MKVVEVHVLQNVAPANLNRDDTGSPKSAMFGGFRRARVSSQSQKRAVREAFPGHLPVDNLAVRTKKLLSKLVEKLAAHGKAEEDAKVAAKAVLEGVGLGIKNDSTEYLLFIGNEEVDRIADLILEYWDELQELGRQSSSEEGKAKKKAAKAKVPDALKKALESVFDGGRAIDLALFGRMLADRPEWNVDAAAQVAHAISTHKVDREFDFYTAVDDLSPKDETGAGMMGDVEFYSATLYRYANVNLEKLAENLQGDRELVLRGLRAFLQSFVDTLPSGKQNTFAAHNPPDFVVVTVREGGPRNLANAFAKPVWRGREGLVASSVAALDEYMGKINRAYGGTKSSAHFLNLSTAKPSRAGREHPSLTDLLDAVMKDVEELVEVT